MVTTNMQHFINFFSVQAEGADFGITKQLNKTKRSALDVSMGLGGHYGWFPISRENTEKSISLMKPEYRSQLKPEQITNGRFKRNRNLETIKQEEIKSRPVKEGKENPEYYTKLLSRNRPKQDLVTARNIKKVASNAGTKLSRQDAMTNSSPYVYNGQFMTDEQAKTAYDSSIRDSRRAREFDRDIDQPKLKPALRAKSERLDFSPTTEQLQGVLNKNYPDYKDYVNHPKDLLITGSPNHTWLTNNGKYMEMPIGQEEMPLDASMWKGRKSGMRLPAKEIKGMGDTGSPVLGVRPSKLYNMNSTRSLDHLLENNLIQSNDSYNNQVTNKRYVPKD